jgi:catechol 2,3-dioxygenase-like lactoylglutathione lyase family enzyme
VFIDHINISAPAGLLEQVKAFYCDVLGLEEGFRPSFRADGYWLYHGDRALVHLIVDDLRRPLGEAGCFDHFAIRGRDMPALIDKLDERKIRYTVGRVDETGLSQVFFKDPAGTGVEVQFVDDFSDRT